MARRFDKQLRLGLGGQPNDARRVDPRKPTPHFDKLQELLHNEKLPQEDKPRVKATLERYKQWIGEMQKVSSSGDERVIELVSILNEYKLFVEVELIWDSPQDFLYRQRGQLKLDSSIIEEFLPWLVDPRIIPELEGTEYYAGPKNAFSAVYFTASLALPLKGGGLEIRTKDHDFTVGRSVYIQASFDKSFPAEDTLTRDTYLAFLAAECKTNLDKTMFQEAAATAHDLKTAVVGARYYVLCEWLDMTPISTATTDIDEVIILRGKRLPSARREKHATAAGRQAERDWYIQFLKDHPIKPERVLRFVGHMRALFSMVQPDEADVLSRGYF